MKLFAREAVEICSGQGTTLRKNVSKRIVQVCGNHRLVRVDEAGDVAVGVRVVVGVGKSKGQSPKSNVRPGEKSADASGTLERAAKVRSAGVDSGGQVVDVALLNDHVAVVVHN